MSLLTLLPIDYILGMGAWLAFLVVAVWGLLGWRRSRRLAKRSLRGPHFGLAIWMMLATFTAPEVLCSLFYDATDSFSQTNVSRRWFDRHVQVNRAGYRDGHELPTVREAGHQYVAFIGDSFTFGHGVRNVADRFSDRVGFALADEGVVASNIALPGLEIRQLVDKLLPELEQQQVPIDVLVYTFVPNDIEYCDERTAAFYQKLAGCEPRLFLWKQTYFYNLLYHRLAYLSDSGRGDYYGYLTGSYAGAPWQRFAAKLDQLHNWCRQHNVQLQVVIFPFLTSLGSDDPFAPAYATLSEYCRTESIPCLDLTPTLTEHRREGLVVSRFDAHPNAKAHALAAEAILPVVRQHLTLPRSERLPSATRTK